ncbi:response regulator transcription factor [Fusibacter tunisiensis]|uniref:Stage 0 sporulation protein A homolog n=1 Tax=Fusibacter tunisiensis TaxID=1008308 RepID=A0ABS2MSU8_9FIRM|nr:response regulator transcription factor [Fusibacter tunisiensis]MBM7562491.1 DNA-binding NarL/FixJ family response regulator [Fusibacter tunisiensis]
MRVVLIDDDELVTLSLQTILESDEGIEVIGTGKNGMEAIDLYNRLKPDILLMDIRMDGMNGIEAGTAIMADHPEAKILYLTTFKDDDYIVKALKIGAKGYILKQKYDSIIPALKTAFLGQSVFGEEIMTKLPSLLTTQKNVSQMHLDLSEREQEVLCQVAEGLSNKEIAETLFLSEGTVRNYISTILEKLDLRDRTQLAIFYYKNQ